MALVFDEELFLLFSKRGHFVSVGFRTFYRHVRWNAGPTLPNQINTAQAGVH